MKVVNLNKARKARAKADKQARADENAVKFGRSRAQREAEDAAAQKARDKIDGHKREE